MQIELGRGLAIGLLGTLGAIALYGAFQIATGLEPGLVGAPAGLLIGFAVRHGVQGRRGPKPANLATGLTIAAFVLSHVPAVLVRALGRPDEGGLLWALGRALLDRLLVLFVNQQLDSLSAFVQIGLALVMVVVGLSCARMMNE